MYCIHEREFADADFQGKRGVAPPVGANLSPIKGSPPTSPITSPESKENAMPSKVSIPPKTVINVARRPLGTLFSGRNNLPPLAKEQAKARGRRTTQDSSALANKAGRDNGSIKNVQRKEDNGKDMVKQRMREWEKDKE